MLRVRNRCRRALHRVDGRVCHRRGSRQAPRNVVERRHAVRHAAGARV